MEIYAAQQSLISLGDGGPVGGNTFTIPTKEVSNKTRQKREKNERRVSVQSPLHCRTLTTHKSKFNFLREFVLYS